MKKRIFGPIGALFVTALASAEPAELSSVKCQERTAKGHPAAPQVIKREFEIPMTYKTDTLNSYSGFGEATDLAGNKVFINHGIRRFAYGGIDGYSLEVLKKGGQKLILRVKLSSSQPVDVTYPTDQAIEWLRCEPKVLVRR